MVINYKEKNLNGIKNNNLTQRLIELGMSEREAKVYQALLNKRQATISELQKSSGVPQCKMYEIMRRLVYQGYCLERKSGRMRTFDVIDPRTALSIHIPKIESRLENAKSLIEDLTKTFAATDKVTEPFEYIEVLHGNETIHKRYCRLVSESEFEILGFGRPPYAWKTTDKLLEQENELKSFMKRSGSSKWVFELKMPDHEPVLDYIESMTRKKVRFRVAETLPVKMMIFDRKTLLIAEEEPFNTNGDLTMSIISQSTMVKAFRALFDYFWGQSADMEIWLKHNSLVQSK